ncbi:Glycosyltransferase involved in cell wall bisynthesis [Pseudobutyrivibrio sp. NOR37]|uniref:glycosyltransferase n=1 Tax=Pseudobutyrivibrio TaxID=46205 RepID=UPI0008EAEA03|nr:MULTISPECIES: glycosyltransferase [Pseudobutyrivibrio]SFR77927.1 Glycosyltransferase involved in cell wall bisynthesis [Pseudobutyrivibrio sp. NOR37]
MKIVLIGPVYPYKGGIAHYTSLLYRALSKENEVTLISYKMQYPKLLFKKEQKDYSSDTFKVDEAKFLINTANPFNIISVAKQINNMNPDAVLIQWWHPYFAPCYKILTSHLKRRIKVFYTCHNVFPHERFPMDRFLTKLVLKKGDGFIVHSKEEFNEIHLIKSGANCIFNPHPTYNAFKIRNISRNEAVREIREKDGLQIDIDSQLLLFFGFVREYKGLKYLLKALSAVATNLPKSKLMVIGSFGKDKDDYLKLIDDLHINHNVFIKDTYTPDDEVEKYFAAADIVVAPYIDATQSGIVQIAYGFEKPCLVTDVGGLPDVVTDKRTGYVVSAGSSEEISEAIMDYFSHNRKNTMVEKVREEAYRFSWERMCEAVGLLARYEDS